MNKFILRVRKSDALDERVFPNREPLTTFEQALALATKLQGLGLVITISSVR
jgi:hypothetical protein